MLRVTPYCSRMYLLILAIFLLPSLLEATPTQWRIVGGMPADDGEFPHQVSLRFRGRHFCGGSIIKSQWIVTAAHCLYRMPASDMSVIVGTNMVNKGGEEYKIEKLFVHEKWNPINIVNDIGLIKLKSAIIFNEKVSPIQLNDVAITNGSELILSGWGRLSFPGLAPDRLQFIKLETIPLEECKEKLAPLFVYKTEICTYNDVGQGSCKGDSGGPLVFNKKLAGIVSWGQPCAIGYPDVFTNVSNYLDWIQVYLKS